MHVCCEECGGAVAVESPRRLPPWCPACGADLRGVAVPEPAAAESLSEQDWRDRFGLHNVLIGILLAVWAAVQTARPPDSGGGKVLAAHTDLNALLGAVQLVTLVNGVLLVVSGVAIRCGWRSGYPLAVVCALVQVAAGGIFFAGYREMSGGRFLEHGVALYLFVLYNLDMLIGLVDGLGLLWFLTARVGAPTRRSTSNFEGRGPARRGASV